MPDLRDSDDPRLPAISPTPWALEGKNIWSGARGGLKARVGAPSEQYPCAENDRRLMAAAPELQGAVFCLLVNFPKLLDESEPSEDDMEDKWSLEELCNLKDWLEGEAWAWKEALEKSGVRL